MKKFMIVFVGGLCATVAHATDVATTQAYVDSAANALQDNLPAKTSDKVATYTTTPGTTGEREIKTELGNESTNQADNGIPTVGTVKTAVDDKQKKVTALPATNLVTYSNTAGTPTVTPIYDSTVNTFDNGLVTAKTLNDAVIAAVEAEVTKIQTPKGALWRINRTAPKVLPTTANLPANVVGTDVCYKRLYPVLPGSPNLPGSCSETMYENMDAGDWGAVFPYETGITYPSGTTCSGESCGKEIRGISVCSSPAGVPRFGIIGGYLVQTLNAQYQNSKTSGEAGGSACYCRLVEPAINNEHWVFYTNSNASHCATNCATFCATTAITDLTFRTALFSAAAVPAQ